MYPHISCIKCGIYTPSRYHARETSARESSRRYRDVKYYETVSSTIVKIPLNRKYSYKSLITVF